jgi:hypothetical protein
MPLSGIQDDKKTGTQAATTTQPTGVLQKDTL